MKHFSRFFATMLLVALLAAPGTASADQAPAAPALVSPVDSAKSLSDSVTFDWSPSTDDVGIAKYELYLNGVRLASTSPSTTEFLATNLPDVTSAPWRVVAHDTAGNRAPSVQRRITINADPPVLLTAAKPTWRWDWESFWPVFGHVALDGDVYTDLYGAAGSFNDPTYTYNSPGAEVGGRHWISVNDGTWNPFGGRFPVELGKRYRVRTQLEDDDGRVSSTITGPYHTMSARQNTHTSLSYTGTWSTRQSTATVKHYGGSHRETSALGASVQMTFTGREIAWATYSRPSSGVAKVYIDGVYVSSVDTRGENPNDESTGWGERTLIETWAWPTTGTHTIKLVNQATAGRARISIDAFMVLK